MTETTNKALTLRVAADSWIGDPQFLVTVDGQQVGGVQTATASRALGQWQDITLTGDFPADPSEVAVSFINDAYGGTAATDRNLYVQSLTLNGITYLGSALPATLGPATSDSAVLLSNGTITFSTASTPAATPSASPAGTATAQGQDAAGNASASLSQSSTTAVPPTGHLAMLGVNLSGAEYSADKLPGVAGTDYTYPNDAEIDYYAQKGFNVIRLPFLWERAQPTAGGPLSASELSQMDAVVNYANAKGMKVILDPHNYGSGYGNLIGSAGTPTSAFADFWGKLAGHYASNGDVMFGLMNEPQVPSATAWLGDANAAIAAIRASGATSQEVLVPGAYWDGGASWTTTDNASVIGTGIKDPSNNFVFEVHQYLDSDASGTHADVVSPTVGSSRLAAITQWAKDTGSRLFLGEFGVAQDATSLSAMDDMLSYISKNSDVWQGATDWAGGAWLWDNMYSVEPTGLGTASVTDKPQMAVLQKYAPDRS